MRFCGKNSLSGSAAILITGLLILFLLCACSAGLDQSNIVPPDKPPYKPWITINNDAGLTRVATVDLLIRADNIAQGIKTHQMRITCSGQVDTGWIPFKSNYSLRLATPGANVITVVLRNAAGKAAISGIVTWLPPGYVPDAAKPEPKHQPTPPDKQELFQPLQQPGPSQRTTPDLTVQNSHSELQIRLADWQPSRQANLAASRVRFASSFSEPNPIQPASGQGKAGRQYQIALFGHGPSPAASGTSAGYSAQTPVSSRSQSSPQTSRASAPTGLFGHGPAAPKHNWSLTPQPQGRSLQNQFQAQPSAAYTNPRQSVSPAVWTTAPAHTLPAAQVQPAPKIPPAQPAQSTQTVQPVQPPTPLQAVEDTPLAPSAQPQKRSTTTRATSPHYQSRVNLGNRVSDFFGVGGFNVSMAPYYLDNEAYLRLQTSAQIPTSSYRRGLRFDGTFGYSQEGNQLVQLNGTLGSKFFSGGQALITAGYLQRHLHADFPTAVTDSFPENDKVGGDLGQMMLALDLQYAFSKIPETDDPGLGLFARGWYASVDSELLGSDQVVRKDGGLYLLEYGFGGGQEMMFQTGLILGNQALEIRPSVGWVSREYEEFLGYAQHDEQHLSGGLELLLKDLMGGNASLYTSYDHGLQTYGGKLNIPISDDFSLDTQVQYVNSSTLSSEWQGYLGLQYSFGRIDKHGAPKSKGLRQTKSDISWLKPVSGTTQATIRVVRPLYRYTYLADAGERSWAQPVIRQIPDQDIDMDTDFSLNLAGYTNQRGVSGTTWSASGLPPGLGLETAAAGSAAMCRPPATTLLRCRPATPLAPATRSASRSA